MPQALPLFDLLPVFNAQPGATLLLSPEWVIVGASDDYLATTLTERETLVGQFIFDAFPDNPLTPEANAVFNVRASLAQVMATKKPHDMAPQHYDVPDQTRPGQFIERYWKPLHTPVLDAAGQIQFIIQSVQDITANRIAERQLRESQAREQRALAEAERQRAELQRVFAQSPVAMGLLRGPELLIEMANARMGQIWGRPVAQLLGRPHFEALPDLAGQGFEQVLSEVLSTGQPYQQLEQIVTIAHLQHSYKGYLTITYLPERDAHGQPTGILIYASDVTEQVRARQQVQLLNQELEARVQQRTEELAATNEELHQSNARLIRTNADLDNFIYTASHDLKQPIANIEGLLLGLRHELAAAPPATELVAPMLDLMQGAVERFQRTINDLTDISRLQHAHAQPAQAVRIAQVIDEVALDLGPALRAAGGELVVSVPPEATSMALSEKNLRSVVYNLLSNALKYRAPDRPPHVRLSYTQTAGQQLLRVQDNGLGLDERQQGKLFGLFQRLHTHVEGTGIGLYMVKKIVESAGGTVTVQSVVGIGSTFSLSLPI